MQRLVSNGPFALRELIRVSCRIAGLRPARPLCQMFSTQQPPNSGGRCSEAAAAGIRNYKNRGSSDLNVGCVQDRVGVALLGEETLAVLSEVLVDGVACDERVERRSEVLGLGAQQAAEALGLLLARTV